MRTSSIRITPGALLRAAALCLITFAGSSSFVTSHSTGVALASEPGLGSSDAMTAHVPEKTEPISQRTQPKLEPTYKIQAGLNNEIYPVFANQAALQKREERTWGTVSVTVANSTDLPLHNRIAVQVPGWSDQEVQIVDVAAAQSRTVLFAPVFLPRFFQNRELAAASVTVNVTDAAGRTVFSETAPVRLRAADDMYWGDHFKFAPYIASWVTPHDPEVEMVLSRAKEFAPLRRLPGYEEWKDIASQEKSTLTQARAIYRAVQTVGVSYVKSSLTFGGNQNMSERVRMPSESLRGRSANCIDGVVLYASLFENLGMEPAVVLVPGHAYLGVRTARDSERYLYFDTALTGRADFEAAVTAAEHGMGRIPESQISMIRVEEARHAGIFPMPESQYPDGVRLGSNTFRAHKRLGAKSPATALP